MAADAKPGLAQPAAAQLSSSLVLYRLGPCPGMDAAPALLSSRLVLQEQGRRKGGPELGARSNSGMADRA